MMDDRMASALTDQTGILSKLRSRHIGVTAGRSMVRSKLLAAGPASPPKDGRGGAPKLPASSSPSRQAAQGPSPSRLKLPFISASASPRTSRASSFSDSDEAGDGPVQKRPARPNLGEMLERSLGVLERAGVELPQAAPPAPRPPLPSPRPANLERRASLAAPALELPAGPQHFLDAEIALRRKVAVIHALYVEEQLRLSCAADDARDDGRRQSRSKRSPRASRESTTPPRVAPRPANVRRAEEGPKKALFGMDFGKVRPPSRPPARPAADQARRIPRPSRRPGALRVLPQVVARPDRAHEVLGGRLRAARRPRAGAVHSPSSP